MNLKLFHYSESRITALNGTGYAQLKDQFKPLGIWLSVGRAWKRWCEEEGFGLDRLRYEHHVTIATETILLLRSAGDIDRFTHLYGSDHPASNYRSIAWDRVAETYGGIMIAPYCWARRHQWHTSWYYSWDVPSACIWDFAAIKDIRS